MNGARWNRFFPITAGSQAIAQGMADAFAQEISPTTLEITKFQQRVQQLQIDKQTWEAMYDAAVKTFQGAHAQRGTLANDLAYSGYQKLFSPWNAKVEQKIAIGKKRDIDLLVELPKGDLYVSVTTRPQERKDKVWPAEFNEVAAFRRVHGHHRPFRFIALMYEYKKDAIDKENKAAIKRKQQLMNTAGANIKVACVMVPDQHATVLQEIMGSLI